MNKELSFPFHAVVETLTCLVIEKTQVQRLYHKRSTPDYDGHRIFSRNLKVVQSSSVGDLSTRNYLRLTVSFFENGIGSWLSKAPSWNTNT